MVNGATVAQVLTSDLGKALNRFAVVSGVFHAH